MYPSAVIKWMKCILKCNSRSTHFPTPDNRVEKFFWYKTKQENSKCTPGWLVGKAHLFGYKSSFSCYLQSLLRFHSNKYFHSGNLEWTEQNPHQNQLLKSQPRKKTAHCWIHFWLFISKNLWLVALMGKEIVFFLFWGNKSKMAAVQKAKREG